MYHLKFVTCLDTETYTASPEGGYITRSQVRVSVGHQDHNSVFTCQANNVEFGQTVADTLTLSVLCKYMWL